MHRRHGRGHGRRRQSARTAHLLEPALLIALLHGPTHGYGMAEALVAFGLEETSLRRIYRALSAMEEQGWVSSDWDTEQTQGPPRRVYGLTPEGRRVLEGWTAHLAESQEVIGRLLAVYRRHT